MHTAALLRGARQSAIARPLAQATSFRPSARAALQQRTYAEAKKNGAEPKILKDERPDESNVSEEVRKHNEEVERRAGQPQEKNKTKGSTEDVEKDKVPKGYWQGSQAGVDKESP